MHFGFNFARSKPVLSQEAGRRCLGEASGVTQHAVSHNYNKQCSQLSDSTLPCERSLLWPPKDALGIQTTY